MKVNTLMPKKLKPFYLEELQNYKINFKNGDLPNAWFHLERAHILGQAYPWHHSYVHWKMLMFGIYIKDRREIIGQIPRLLAGGIKSFVGKIPVGNTGGADVPPLRSLPISGELREILKFSK